MACEAAEAGFKSAPTLDPGLRRCDGRGRGDGGGLATNGGGRVPAVRFDRLTTNVGGRGGGRATGECRSRRCSAASVGLLTSTIDLNEMVGPGSAPQAHSVRDDSTQCGASGRRD